MSEPRTDGTPGAEPAEVDHVRDRPDGPFDEDAFDQADMADTPTPEGEEFQLRVPAPEGELALRAANLGIRYNLNLTKKTKLRTSFATLFDRRRRQGDRHFWALRNIDLTVRRGEAVGVVGPNGSGKSTLLLALAGIIQPSEGVVEANGHVSTLLSLQAGFDSDLSGRENIALAGALMGIDHKVMGQITPGIISFANIGAFIDAPMKTYSSGMRARVGFSIATAVDPDILLLDEVLQTGDNSFKKKSRRRIAEVLQTAKAVVMVTHDMSWITAFCTRAILLDKGHIVREGDPEEIADIHEEDAEKRKLNRRKAVQLVKHGKADIVDLRKARRAGTLGEVVAAADAGTDDEDPEAESTDELRALRATVAAEQAERRVARDADAATEARTSAGRATASTRPSTTAATDEATTPESTDAPTSTEPVVVETASGREGSDRPT